MCYTFLLLLLTQVLIRFVAGIAFTAKMVRPKAAANNDWFFQKVFGDGEFIAAGQLIIPPKGRKPSKGTKDNTYVRFSIAVCKYFNNNPILMGQVFYVIEGAVNLKVNNTTLVLASGAMFLVPRGVYFSIRFISSLTTIPSQVIHISSKTLPREMPNSSSHKLAKSYSRKTKNKAVTLSNEHRDGLVKVHRG